MFFNSNATISPEKMVRKLTEGTKRIKWVEEIFEDERGNRVARDCSIEGMGLNLFINFQGLVCVTHTPNRFLAVACDSTFKV